MANTIVKQIRHPKEQLYGGLVTVAGTILWLIAAAGLAALLAQNQGVQLLVLLIEVVIFTGVLQLFKLFFRAWLFGHAVLVSPDQFPALHERLAAAARKLGLNATPQTFIYNSHGLTNAFAMRILRTRMVLLTSAILDVGNDAQVDFIVGHELGHHAAGHLSFWKNLLRYPGLIVPFLGPAYHRARELTADRVGAFCSGDYDASRTALQMLACGSARLNSSMNADAFSAQEAQVPAITGFLLHIFSGYPRLTRRAREVEELFRTFRPDRPAAVPKTAPVAV